MRVLLEAKKGYFFIVLKEEIGEAVCKVEELPFS